MGSVPATGQLAYVGAVRSRLYAIALNNLQTGGAGANYALQNPTYSAASGFGGSIVCTASDYGAGSSGYYKDSIPLVENNNKTIGCALMVFLPQTPINIKAVYPTVYDALVQCRDMFLVAENFLTAPGRTTWVGRIESGVFLDSWDGNRGKLRLIYLTPESSNNNGNLCYTSIMNAVFYDTVYNKQATDNICTGTATHLILET